MIKRKSNRTLILLILAFIVFNTNAQTSISGIINNYAKCISFSGLSNSSVVDNASQFHKNDTVLIIQMKGAVIQLGNNNNFGKIDSLYSTGSFEFNVIDSVNIPTNTVYFKCNLINNYTGLTQIVRVPNYTNAQVNGVLTAKAWDGSSGGVLVLIDHGQLKLNADIDVTGKGFRGANPTFNSNPFCATTSTGFFNYSYTSLATDSAGLKGEGIKESIPFFSRGRGKFATAGGGGHTYDAAGGGGSCYGAGGIGGTEADTCTTVSDLGGFGGDALNAIVNGQFRLFLGGGGGAGLYESNSLNDATAGGNGGGIIIIAADLGITGNNKNIIANGSNVFGQTTYESAGGGGGGGCIAIICNNVTSLASIQAKGGNGGTTFGNCRGSGGGGGGGLIAVPSTIPGSICNINGGFPGGVNNTGTCNSFFGTNGNGGHIVNNFTFPMPPCFNLIPITNNIIFSNQNVCQGNIPANITGTIPQGGDNINYAYQWEQSFDGINWTIIPGATGSSFVFAAPISQTIYFRRIVTSGMETDVSNQVSVNLVVINVSTSFVPITCFGACNGSASANVSGMTGITYHWSNGMNSPIISGLCSGTYSVTATHTLSGCTDTSSVNVNQPPLLTCSITQNIIPSCQNNSTGKLTAVATGGTFPYVFFWSNGQTTETISNLLPGSYSVTITDLNGCMVSSSTVLNSTTSITNNIIEKYRVVCGSNPVFPIFGNIPNGVDTTTTYGFWWIQTNDTTSNSWIPAVPGNTSQNYVAPNPGITPMFYRRITIYNGCADTSNTCKVWVYPGSTSLDSSIISPLSQTVNYSQLPVTITGNIINGGISGETIRHLWQKSTNLNFTPSLVANEGTYTSSDLSFNQGADTSFYYMKLSYFVIFISPDSVAACVEYSNLSRVLLLDSNNISCADTLYCSPSPLSIITGNTGSGYTYQWQKYNGTTWINIPGQTNPDFQPTTSDLTGIITKIRRVVFIGGNPIFSNIINIHYYPQIGNNTILTTSGNNIEVCQGNGSITIFGLSLTGGDGFYNYHWYYSFDNTNWDTASFGLGAAYITPAIWDTMYFRREVNSGTCLSISNVITIRPVILPLNELFIPYDSVCSGSDAEVIIETSNTQGMGYNWSWEKKPISTGVWTQIPNESNYYYHPVGILENTSYRRILVYNQVSPACTSLSNEINIYVKSNPNYTLQVPLYLDTVPLGTISKVIVSLIGTPSFSFDLFDGMNYINVVTDSFTKSIIVVPYQNPTTYTLVNLVDGTGCSFNGVGTSVQVNIIATALLEPGMDTAFCGNVGSMNAVSSPTGINWWTGPWWISFSDTLSPSTQISSSLYNVNSQLFWHVRDGLFEDSVFVHAEFDEMIAIPDAGIDITLVGVNAVQLNAAIPSPSGSTGNWTIYAGSGVFGYSGTANSNVSGLQNGENILVWTVTNGVCGPLSDTLNIFVTDLLIPQGFSPNGDGKNDFFEITGIETFDVSELLVFNRWGDLVYSKSNYDNSWNGYGNNNRPSPEDTYFYVFTFDKETRKGYIVLKR